MHSANPHLAAIPLRDSELMSIHGGDLPDALKWIKNIGWLGLASWAASNWKDIEAGYQSVSSDKL